ncbi:MAG: GNAT family N-acetyltransferase [Bacteroidales bacterium]|jgi:hypothetical protein|nr:GNAT family N-acetyltransferase [Bacteroidales bacterium]
MNNKEKYALFVRQNEDIPIFLTDWWQEIVNKGNWDALFVERKGDIIAAMPYSIRRKWGFSSIITPVLTPISGFHIAYPDNIGRIRRISIENQVMREFARSLGRLKISFYSHKHSFRYPNWLGYKWEGFSQTSLPSYHIDLTRTWEAITADMHPDTKRLARNASKQLIVSKNGVSIKAFCDLNVLTYERQKMRMPFDYEVLYRLTAASLERHQALLLSAETSDGRLAACVLCVFDRGAFYTPIAASNPDLQTTNAATLLYYEAIRHAYEQRFDLFDFTGSSMPQIEHLLRYFGAVQTPYNLIERYYSPLFRHLRLLK